MEQNGSPTAIRDPNSAQPSNDQNHQQQSSSHRMPVAEIGEQAQQQRQQPQQQQPSQRQQYNPRDLRYAPNGRYYVDDLHSYPDDASVYFQGLLNPLVLMHPSHPPLAARALRPLRHRSSTVHTITGTAGTSVHHIAPSHLSDLRTPTLSTASSDARTPPNPPITTSSTLTATIGQGPTKFDQAMVREQYAKQSTLSSPLPEYGLMIDLIYELIRQSYDSFLAGIHLDPGDHLSALMGCHRVRVFAPWTQTSATNLFPDVHACLHTRRHQRCPRRWKKELHWGKMGSSTARYHPPRGA